jgi:branched-chain amino acid transport system ATP-binding protein
VIVEEVMRGIERMTREQGMTVILVEQHADIALELTQQAVVLERGIIVHRGRSAELLGNQAMLDRYIGLMLSESET